MSFDITGPIQDLWPNCPVPLLQGIIDTSDDVFAKFGMTDNRNRILHFMVQASAETMGGDPRELTENLNYSSPQRLRQVWPSRFRNKSDAELAPLVHNPAALADAVYMGRMGNNEAGDGLKFEGKGLLNTTGKGLYADLGRVVGLDLVTHPELLLAPNTALLCGVADFVGVCRCLPYADDDDLMNVSAMVNCGHPVSDPSGIEGWAGRQEWYQRWSRALV